MRAESNIDFANNTTKVLGNHALKAGVDIRRVRDDLLQGNNNAAAGTFYFSENQTSAPTNVNGPITKGQANDIASVLFNVPYQVGQDTNGTFPCYRQTWLFFFVADKWQATSKLTVDLGVRYELYPLATPRKPGGFVNYNPTNNQLVVAGQDGNPSNLGMATDYKNIAPRLGASYRVTDKLVVRAGYGISYVPFVDNVYAYNYPIKTSTYYNSVPTYGAALNPAGGLVNFTTGIPATPTVAFGSNGTLTESAANGTIGLANLYVPLNFKNAYVSSWNAVVQQALPSTLPYRSPTSPTTVPVSMPLRTSTCLRPTARAVRLILCSLPLVRLRQSLSILLASPPTISPCRSNSRIASTMVSPSPAPSHGARRKTTRPALRTVLCSSTLAHPPQLCSG